MSDAPHQHRDAAVDPLAHLRSQFESVSTLLERAREAVSEGRCPPDALEKELGELRARFTRAHRILAQESAFVRVKAPWQEADTLASLEAISGEIHRAGVSLNAFEALERVLALEHEGRADAPLLAPAKDRARTLLDIDPETGPVAELADGTRPLAALLILAEEGERLLDNEALLLSESVEEVYGRSLAVAALRGRLRSPEPEPEPDSDPQLGRDLVHEPERPPEEPLAELQTEEEVFAPEIEELRQLKGTTGVAKFESLLEGSEPEGERDADGKPIFSVTDDEFDSAELGRNEVDAEAETLFDDSFERVPRVDRPEREVEPSDSEYKRVVHEVADLPTANIDMAPHLRSRERRDRAASPRERTRRKTDAPRTTPRRTPEPEPVSRPGRPEPLTQTGFKRPKSSPEMRKHGTRATGRRDQRAATVRNPPLSRPGRQPASPSVRTGPRRATGTTTTTTSTGRSALHKTGRSRSGLHPAGNRPPAAAGRSGPQAAARSGPHASQRSGLHPGRSGPHPAQRSGLQPAGRSGLHPRRGHRIDQEARRETARAALGAKPPSRGLTRRVAEPKRSSRFLGLSALKVFRWESLDGCAEQILRARPAERLELIHGLILRLVGDGRYGLAYLLGRVLEEHDPKLQVPMPSWLLRTLAIASHMTRPQGPLEGILRDSLAERDGFEKQYRPPKSFTLFLFASTLRPALLAPSSGATEMLKNLKLDPQLSELARTVAKYGERLQGIEAGELAEVTTLASWKREYQEFLDEARAWCQEASSLTVVNKDATHIWRIWWTQDGLLSDLFEYVWGKKGEDLREISERLESLKTDAQVEAEVNDLQRRIGGKEIRGRALSRLTEHTRSALDWVQRWVDLRSRRPSLRNFVQREFEALRFELKRNSRTILSELDELRRSRKPELASAASCAHRAAADFFGLFERDRPFSRSEPHPKHLLQANLLRLEGLELDEEWLPSGSYKALLKPLLELVEQKADWIAAFQSRLGSKDRVGTQRILEHMRFIRSQRSKKKR